MLGAQVSFGGVLGTTRFISERELRAITPPNNLGTVEVQVTNPNGRTGSLASAFSYLEPLFEDVTDEAGLGDFVCHAGEQIIKVTCGAVAADFNNDGFHDLFVSSFAGPNGLFFNQAKGSFQEIAEAAGVALAASRDNGACAGDYDNDGWTDLYVTAYGPDHLFRNNADGTFTDVTLPTGLGSTSRGSGCAWGDYDKDGFVDLLVANYIREDEPSVFQTRNFALAAGRVLIYHNERGTRFSEVGPELVTGDVLVGAGFGASFVDYDGNGQLDIYIVNDFGAEFRPNVLLRNEGADANGQWHFRDVSDPTGAGVGVFAMGLAGGDYNRDGLLDFYVTNMGANLLLRQLPDQSFQNRAFNARVDRPDIDGLLQVGWGTFFFDYDNDGWLDLYVVDGFLDSAKERNSIDQPNGLYRNRRDGTFEDVSVLSGIDHPGVGRGGVYLDYDNDGRLDVFVANMDEPSRLFRNRVGARNWLQVVTKGTQSNRQGLGARVEVQTGSLTQFVDIRSGDSHMGGSVPLAHFGLGDAQVVNALRVHWPSGVVQTFFQVPANQKVVIPEPTP